MMKIKKDVFGKFLKKITMRGENTINEAVFDFTEDAGVIVRAMTSDNTVLVNGRLSKSAFEGYGALGELGFDKLPMMIRIIDTFKDNVDITVNGGLLKIAEGNSSVEIPLVETQFIPTKGKDLSGIEHDQTVKLSADILNNFMKNVSDANKNSFDVVLTTGDNALQISNETGSIKFREVVPETGTKVGIRVKFGEPLPNAIANIEGDVEVSLKSNFPIKVFEKTDVSEMTVVVAPRVDDDNTIEVDSDDSSSDDSSTEETSTDETSTDE